MRRSLALVALAVAACARVAAAQPSAPQGELQRVTFEDAIRIALEKNPNVADAAQAILRAEALLQQAKTVERPTVSATMTTTVLDAARGFDEFVTQPQTQSFIGASVSYPVLAASRWAARTQAQDQVQIARISLSETRRQVAIAAAEAYLAVIVAQRQVEVNQLARENALAHVDYARRRREGGVGSRLNEMRAAQELEIDEVFLEASRFAVRRAQEALGVLLAADAPIDAAGEPAFAVPPVASGDAWLQDRADVQLFSAQVSAANRVYRDSWKDWLPTATASFEPQLVAPAGLFQPSRTWRGFVSVAVPIYDAGSRQATSRQRGVAVASARIQLTEVQLRARAQLRTAQAAIESSERALVHARLASQHAGEVLRISDIAFREGLTSNIELIDAQRRARDTDTAVAQAEDRVRQARLDLLVAVGRFPQ